MQRKHYADLGVRAALWKIQAQSPFCRLPRRAEDSNNNETRAVRPEWCPSEAGVAWAIWERAVLDAHGFTSPNPAKNAMKPREMREAEHTAETGCIALGGNLNYDLLSALGIDLEWAQGVLQSVTQRFDRLVDSGWKPDGLKIAH